MHLDAELACIHDCCHICCNHGSHSRLLGCLECALHILDIFIVHCDIEGEVGLYAVLRADSHNLLEVGHLEVVGRVRAHIQLLYAEIYGVCTSLYCCLQALEVAGRRHYL